MLPRTLAGLLLLSLVPALARAQGAPPAAAPSADAPPPPPLAPPPLVTPPGSEPAPPIYTPPADASLAPPAAPAPSIPAPALGPGVIRLHVVSPEAMVLKRDAGRAVVYLPNGTRVDNPGALCASPCDAVIDVRDPNASFVFGGANQVPDSSSFSLAGQGGDLTARVSPGSRTARAGSAVLAGLGGILTYVGVVGLTSKSTDGTSNTGAATGILVGGGVLLAAGGLVYLFSRTTYDLSTGAPTGSGGN